ncbi:MAG: prepilin-type N-terminal cleavage/methylation domain-containing protein [Pirellulaceae bacterium]
MRKIAFKNSRDDNRAGFTIVELLVVIAILAIMAAILIPQVRIFNKERGIRETARAIGSALNEASLRARETGFGGVAFVRNPNFFRYGSKGGSNVNPIFHVSNQMYQLRKFPAYSGQQQNPNNPPTGAVIQTTTGAGQFEAVIPYPIDTATRNRIVNMEWRTIILDNRVCEVVSYQTAESGLPTHFRVQCQRQGGVPYDLSQPPGMNGPAIATPRFEVDFTIEFIPAYRTGTLVTLPPSYHLDLNYSGPLDVGDVDTEPFTWSNFGLNVDKIVGGGSVPDIIPNTYPVAITFDINGGVDQIYNNGAWGVIYYSNEMVYFCIAEDSEKYTYDLNPATTNFWPKSALDAPPTTLLNDPNVLWVQLNCLTGKASVVESVPPTTLLNTALPNTELVRILESRGIAVKGVNAAQ